eukprot:SAG22_NODE_3327_length_1777_cov_2.125745_2_plen_87_part_00
MDFVKLICIQVNICESTLFLSRVNSYEIFWIHMNSPGFVRTVVGGPGQKTGRYRVRLAGGGGSDAGGGAKPLGLKPGNLHVRLLLD